MLESVGNHALAIAVAVVFLMPFVFIVLTALMTNRQALTSHLWPHPFHWANFKDVFHIFPLWRYAWNSTLYATLSTVGVVVSSVPVAYALSRLQWRGRQAVFVIVLATLMLPAQVTIVPLYVIFVRLHWIGSLKPLIVPSFFGDAFSIFLLRQFFLTIPQELSDAARVERPNRVAPVRLEDYRSGIASGDTGVVGPARIVAAGLPKVIARGLIHDRVRVAHVEGHWLPALEPLAATPPGKGRMTPAMGTTAAAARSAASKAASRSRPMNQRLPPIRPSR